MAAGVIYDDNAFEVERELYAVDSGYRSQGGFNLDIEGLPAGGHVPVLCPLYIDFVNRKAYVVNNLKVVEAAASGATSIKIQKGSFAKAGKFALSDSVVVTVTKVDTSNEAFDKLTVSAISADVPAGSVLYECATEEVTEGEGQEATVKTVVTAVHTANALNYARTTIETGATITALYRAYEIKEADLYIPVTEADKASLTSRFMFV